MIVLAKSVLGHEFLYDAKSAHRVPKAKSGIICYKLNMAKYDLKEGQVWHVHEVYGMDNAYAYGEMQGFQLQKDGTIRKVGRV